MIPQNSELDLFFRPSSIAILGASEALNSWGARYIKALQSYGYEGKLYAINRGGDEIWGLKIHRSVQDIPDSIDLAVICVPARFVSAMLQDCIKKGIKSAIVLSSGFSELGEEGRQIEEEVTRVAKQGIRVIGPNCFGTYCPEGRLTYVAGGGFPRESGGVSLIAQSGTFSESIVVRAISEGLRFSKVISYGNACDINEADLLEYLMNDDRTEIFISYTEGVKEGRRFFDIARRYSGKKPIVIWKVGLTRMGSEAAASHTGSLAGGSTAWDTFFKQSGAIQVHNFDQLIDSAVGFTCLPGGSGPRVALVSGGGGGTVVGADACEAAGLKMPPFSPETEEKLKSILPSVGTSLKNPLDIGNPHPELKLFRSALEAVASSDNVDIILIRRIFFSIKISQRLGGDAAPSLDEQEEMLQIPVDVKNKYGKPVVIVLDLDFNALEDLEYEGDRRRIRDFFFKNGIPSYLTEDRAFSTIAGLAKFKERASMQYNPAADYAGIKAVSGNIISGIAEKAESPVLSEIQCKEILKQAGVNVVETVLARSKQEAMDISNRLGYPVVMKIVSPQITHKSDAGGVKLGINDAARAGEAYDEIMNSVRQKAPDAAIEGIAVQKMAGSGLELVIGMTRDPQFGPMLMFGIGGIFVEVMQDVAFRIVPLTRDDAHNMIREIKGFRLLEGFRGQPAVDLEYLEELLLKISRFIENNPEIKEMDINPLLATADGLVAVDARIILDK